MEKYSGIPVVKLAAKRPMLTLPGGIPAFRPFTYEQLYFTEGKPVIAGEVFGELMPTKVTEAKLKPRNAENDKDVDGRDLLYPFG